MWNALLVYGIVSGTDFLHELSMDCLHPTGLMTCAALAARAVLVTARNDLVDSMSVGVGLLMVAQKGIPCSKVFCPLRMFLFCNLIFK